jgi:tetratricopeptide (TPR) repeat protein
MRARPMTSATLYKATIMLRAEVGDRGQRSVKQDPVQAPKSKESLENMTAGLGYRYAHDTRQERYNDCRAKRDDFHQHRRIPRTERDFRHETPNVICRPIFVVKTCSLVVAETSCRMWCATVLANVPTAHTKLFCVNHEIFVSYSRADNYDGWVTAFIDAVQREHAEATGGSLLRIFFDRSEIKTMQDWEQRILENLRSSRLLLACLSPNYFASEWCRREWQLYLEHERDQGLRGEGVAPIYLVEVLGFGSAAFDQENAYWTQKIGTREYLDLRPFFPEGPRALERPEIRLLLAGLDQQIAERLDRAKHVARSPTTMPRHNRDFTGRVEELHRLRQALFGGRVGVIAAVHGLGGIGKSALAFEYAHDMAEDYPGGRWLLLCEGHSDLREALRPLARMLGFEFTATEFAVEQAFARLCTEIGSRERMLLLLDNVDQSKLLSPALVARLPADKVHVLVTTRLAPNELPGENKCCLGLDELPIEDTVRLLEKHRPFTSDTERASAEQIAVILGGFALAAEAIGIFLRAESSVDYSGLLERLETEGFTGIERITDTDDSIALSRHREKLLSATLAPSLTRLTPAERVTLEYAALLLSDGVPIPWLKELVSAEFPDATPAPKAGYPDPWIAIVRRLDGMRFLAPGSDPNLRRMHRLVQGYVATLDSDKDERGKKIDPMVASRAERLESTWTKHDTRWEIEPLRMWACRGSHIPECTGESWLAEHVLQKYYLKEAVASWDTQPRRCNVNIAQVCTSVGRVEEALCHVFEASWLFNFAIQLWERCVGQNDARIAQAYADLAAFAERYSNGWAALGEDNRKGAFQLFSQIGDVSPTVLLRFFNKFIRSYPKEGEVQPLLHKSGLELVEVQLLTKRAINLALTVLDDDSKIPPAEIRLFLDALLWIGSNGLAQNRPVMLTVLKKAWQLSEMIKDPSRTALAYRLMAPVLLREGQPGDARSLLLAAIEIQESLLGLEHIELGESYAALAEVEEALGHSGEAQIRWLAAEKIGRKIWWPWGQLDKWTSWTMKAAEYEEGSGNLDSARSLLGHIISAYGGYDALAKSELRKKGEKNVRPYQVLPEIRPTLISAHVLLADIDIHGENLSDARSHLQKAHEIAINHYGENHFESRKIAQHLRDIEG